MAVEGMTALGAGLAIGLTAMAAAYAEKEIGAAAVGAMAEKEQLFTKGLILTVIPETLVIFGLVVALQILA
ncbi:MAG TPA: V-type ATP synthase subunit K [archaeon]|nr:V-type ATP synthase subunit K [Candidatus Aenigmarchaeota archaeon]HLD83443.1 V-type ATP synthase subunit K [archaeon]